METPSATRRLRHAARLSAQVSPIHCRTNRLRDRGHRKVYTKGNWKL